MATSRYFNHVTQTNEQNFYEDLVIESVKIMGIDVLYVPRENLVVDDILGEVNQSAFTKSYTIESHIVEVNGFEGEGDLMSKFGLQIRDTATFNVSKKRFHEEVTERAQRPFAGDLIYLPFSKSLFEITFVEHEDPFYQLGRRYVYRLTTELFTFSNEQFTTGNEDIDSLNVDHTNESIIERAINDEIRTEAEAIKDFSHNNPFGGI